MIKPEILAPAGGEEQLTAAVRAGADAVYLGAQGFNARRGAHNFDREALKRAVDYCHEYAVKVYLTMNTLIRDDEISDAMELFQYACSLPVDAVIVQDIGLARLMHECAPQMRIHASTQMSLHSAGGVKIASQMGFKRVVLAREVSEKGIREMSKFGTELEAFVHGALCMSVSGQCYLSAMLGSRSGNRGACAQPCRLPFSCGGKSEYALSLKDLSLLDKIDRLSDAGICSLKIEGRMKRPEYVAASVASCRYARDEGEIPEKLRNELDSVFSRSGFTSGYFDSVSRVNAGSMFGFRRYEDVSAATSDVMKSLHSLYAKERGRVAADIKFTAHEGEKICLSVSADGKTAEIEGAVPEKAVNKPLDNIFIGKQLSKTGGTPYIVKSISADIGEGLSVMASELNSMRREALSALTHARKKDGVPCDTFEDGFDEYIPESKMQFRGIFKSAEIPKAAEKLDLVYVPSGISAYEFEKLRERGLKIALEAPRALFDGEDLFRRQLEVARNANVDCVMVQNLGEIPIAREFGMNIHAGFGLNILNTYSLETARRLGVEECEMSIEATLDDISSLGAGIKRGVVIYGYIPLMLMRNCPIACSGAVKCDKCGGKSALTDRKGMNFRVICTNGVSELLNPVPLCMFDRIEDIINADFATLRFTVENSVEIGETIDACLKRSNPFREFTRGLLYRGVM